MNSLLPLFAAAAAAVFVPFLCFLLLLLFPDPRPRRPPSDDPAHPQRASDGPRKSSLDLQGRGLEGRVQQRVAGRAAGRRVRDLEQRRERRARRSERRRRRVFPRRRPSSASPPDPREPDADGVRAPSRRARDRVGGRGLQEGREGRPAELRGRLAVRGLFFVFVFFFSSEVEKKVRNEEEEGKKIRERQLSLKKLQDSHQLPPRLPERSPHHRLRKPSRVLLDQRQQVVGDPGPAGGRGAAGAAPPLRLVLRGRLRRRRRRCSRSCSVADERDVRPRLVEGRGGLGFRGLPLEEPQPGVDGVEEAAEGGAAERRTRGRGRRGNRGISVDRRRQRECRQFWRRSHCRRCCFCCCGLHRSRERERESGPCCSAGSDVPSPNRK